ncbi:MAG TPA: PilZ domain-containing protein [Kofleriaceae bacterium]|nr:PilZ domain-containing protein [Kofleriaceae bacterium]
MEAFLLIEQPRQRLGHWIRALTPLDADNAPPIKELVGYYDPTCDQALINLQYDPESLENGKLEFVMSVALLAEVAMVQPAELSEGERVRFLAERLPRCTIRVTGQPNPIAVLTEIVRKIKIARSAKTVPPPIPAAATARSMQPRGDTADPVMLVAAKGTRDDLEQIAKRSSEVVTTSGPRPGTPNNLPPPALAMPLPLPPPPPTPAPELINPMTSSRHVVSRRERSVTAEMPPALSQKLMALPMDNDYREEDERNTQEVDPSRYRELVDEAGEDVPLPPARRADSPGLEDASAEPFLPTNAKAGMIYARYLRSGRWVPVRVGALSLKGAALLTGALPRLKDRVDVALSFDNHRALVRGIVGKVSTVREAALTGAATFSIAFELDEAAKKQLTALLTAARDAKVTIKPPPPRATRRFPVEWPIALGTSRGAVKATALDVSTGGMFVKPNVSLELGATVGFSVVLDDGSAPIAGRAKVVRLIGEREAKLCGIAAGFGLSVIEMSEADRMRWLGFLARIERRAEKRVLIGAEPSRLAELQAGLAGCGYAVVGGTDPGALVQLASGDARPADAVLIDAGWLQSDGSATLVESLFSARNVPCVTMNGEVRRARQAIDRLLEVVV